MRQKSVFIDSSFFKALLDADDDFYMQAIKIWKFFLQQSTPLVTTNYIIDETLTLIRNRCGLELALDFRSVLTEYASSIKLIRVTVDDDAGAWQWFEKDWSKLSYTDCVSFVVMKRFGITHVATFDEHFKRAGFTLVS